MRMRPSPQHRVYAALPSIARVGTPQPRRKSVVVVGWGQLLKSRLHSEHNLNANIPKEGRIVPAFKAIPLLFQRIGETNPSLAADEELNSLGVAGILLPSERFVDLLRHKFAGGRVVTNRWDLPILASRSSVLVRSPCGCVHI